MKNLSKGLCPICAREMIDADKSINEHHFIPKSRGGKTKTYLHAICHRFIHSQWTEKQLEQEFNTPESIVATEEAQRFIKFVSKKSPLFYDGTFSSNKKKKYK